MSIEIPTQPIPSHIAEACAWLSAAERHTGQQLRHRLDAGDVIDILCDVHPPYPPIDTSRRTMPLTDAAPTITQALERAVTIASSVEENFARHERSPPSASASRDQLRRRPAPAGHPARRHDRSTSHHRRSRRHRARQPGPANRAELLPGHAHRPRTHQRGPA